MLSSLCKIKIQRNIYIKASSSIKARHNKWCRIRTSWILARERQPTPIVRHTAADDGRRPPLTDIKTRHDPSRHPRHHGSDTRDRHRDINAPSRFQKVRGVTYATSYAVQFGGTPPRRPIAPGRRGQHACQCRCQDHPPSLRHNRHPVEIPGNRTCRSRGQ